MSLAIALGARFCRALGVFAALVVAVEAAVVVAALGVGSG